MTFCQTHEPIPVRSGGRSQRQQGCRLEVQQVSAPSHLAVSNIEMSSAQIKSTLDADLCYLVTRVPALCRP